MIRNKRLAELLARLWGFGEERASGEWTVWQSSYPSYLPDFSLSEWNPWTVIGGRWARVIRSNERRRLSAD